MRMYYIHYIHYKKSITFIALTDNKAVFKNFKRTAITVNNRCKQLYADMRQRDRDR